MLEGTAKGGDAADLLNGLTQFGWDCIIIPGAFTNTVANSGVITTQTTAGLTNRVTSDAALLTAGQGPHICGNKAGIGAGVASLTVMAYDKNNAIAVSTGIIASTTICSKYLLKSSF